MVQLLYYKCPIKFKPFLKMSVTIRYNLKSLAKKFLKSLIFTFCHKHSISIITYQTVKLPWYKKNLSDNEIFVDNDRYWQVSILTMWKYFCTNDFVRTKGIIKRAALFKDENTNCYLPSIVIKKQEHGAYLTISTKTNNTM